MDSHSRGNPCGCPGPTSIVFKPICSPQGHGQFPAKQGDALTLTLSRRERELATGPLPYWQHRLRPVGGQFHLERIQEERRLGVVAHQRRQLDQVLHSELLQRDLEG